MSDEKLDQQELLTMQLYNERLGRMDAQLKNLVMQEGLLRQELESQKNEFKTFSSTLASKYKMGPKDSVNIQSGQIKREEAVVEQASA